MRRFLFLFLPLFLLTFFLYGRVFYSSFLVVSQVIPGLPKFWLPGAYEVTFQEVEFEKGQKTKAFDLYFPKGRIKAPFIIFFTGFDPEGAREEKLVNLVQALAKTGIGVAIPHTESVVTSQFSPEDIESIKEVFGYLKDQPFVKKEKIGLSGFCIGGSYVLRAAEDLGEEVLFVHAFGPYYDLSDLMIEVETEEGFYQGESRPWPVDPHVKKVYEEALINSLSEQKIVSKLLGEKNSPEEAKKLFGLLPEEFKRKLKFLSPSFAPEKLKTKVFLMHDREDQLIPVEESRKLRDALPPEKLAGYTEFTFIKHVTPQEALNPIALKEIFLLFRQLFRIFLLLQ